MTPTTVPPVTGAPPLPAPDRTRSLDALLLALGALAVRVPAFVSFKQLGFDDGQFAVSVLAMRHGGLPYRDVFASQGPLFLPLAWLFDLLTLRTIDSPRAVAVLAGVALTVAVYAAGRELTTRRGALLAAALVATSGSVLWTTGPLTSDGPALALAAATVAVALGYRRAPSAAAAAAIGLLAGGAFAIKSLLALPALVVAALVVLAARRWRDVGLAAACAGVLVLAISVPWGLGRVYEQSVAYHTDKAGQRTWVANATKTARTLGDRDVLLVTSGLLAAGLAAAGALGRRGRRARSPDRAGAPGRTLGGVLDRLTTGAHPIVVWLTLVVLVLVAEHPMWRNHVAHLVPPAALLIGIRPPPTRALAAVLLVALPYHAVHLRELLWPHDYTGRAAVVVHRLRELPPPALEISDDPGLVWRAGHRPPDELVDVSILRITATRPSLRVTEDDTVRAAARPDVCAVVVWSSVRFGSFAGLPKRLEAVGYTVADARPGSPRVLYLKRDCEAGRRAVARHGGPSGRATAGVGADRSPG